MKRTCACGSTRLRYTSDEVCLWEDAEAPEGCETDIVRIPGYRCLDCLRFNHDVEELGRVRRARRIALAKKARSA